MPTAMLTVIQGKQFVSPTPPTLTAVIHHYQIPTPSITIPPNPFPRQAAMLVMDFTTLNLQPPIGKQDFLYCTDFIACEYLTNGKYRHHHFLCDDPATRTGDYFFVRQALSKLIEEKGPQTSEYFVFSDGCSGQFKSRFFLLLLLLLFLLLLIFIFLSLDSLVCCLLD
jgi:hypothetical protein